MKTTAIKVKYLIFIEVKMSNGKYKYIGSYKIDDMEEMKQFNKNLKELNDTKAILRVGLV